MSRWSESRIFTALMLKDDQTFTELEKSTNINNFSFKRGLAKLRDDETVILKQKLYSINSEIRHPMLLKLKDSFTQAKLFGLRIDKLKDSSNPIDDGFLLILECMRLSVVLTIDELSTKKLNPKEEDEFENYSIFCNTAIKLIFDILRKINKKRIEKLKNALKFAMLDPNLIIKLEKIRKKEEKKLS